MSYQVKSVRIVSWLIVAAAFVGPTVAWGQIPDRGFRSAAPSRVIPVENIVPAEEEQEPTPAEPLRAFAPRPIPAGEGRGAIPRELRPLPNRDVIPAATLRDNTRTKASELVADRSAASAKGAKLSASKSDPQAAGESKDAKTDDSKNAGEPKEGTELVKDQVQLVWQKILEVWRYKFFETKDLNLSLQVFVGGLLLLWIGHKLARRLSTWLGETILRRVGLPPATAAPLQKMSFYILFGLFAVFSLQLVGVPMTVFTFFGGALAIGIGFGSQNVMNNFISGLILLIERPIRVGDVIQIDSHSGKVSEIGARSTRVTTGSNLEVIIPNSTFLQGNVVNWTLSDDVVSSKVTVGVAYGSPAREVARLLKQAAEEHDKILKTPGPGVSFTDFAADSMQFELSFWLKMSQADRGRVESDLRFKIDELFADRGIVIAYPQRDVHLSLMRPVEVRLTEPSVTSRELRGAA